MNIIPFPSAYHVIDNKLIAGGFPGSDNDSARKIKLGGLKKTGVKVVVNLMEADEKNYQNKLFDDYAPYLHKFGIQTKRFPIKDMTVPAIDQMTEILNFIDKSISENMIVYVHCWGGIGRTGTVVGCYLVRHGFANKTNVFEKINQLKSGASTADRQSPETQKQRNFVLNWEAGK